LPGDSQGLEIFQEVFVPYNCHELLTLMIGVDIKYKKPSSNLLYRRVMGELWKEVLSEPIKPMPKIERLRLAFSTLMRDIGVCRIAWRMYYRTHK